jgi:hypothetical protein
MQQEEMIVSLVAIGSVFGLPFLGFVIWIIADCCLSAFRSWQEIGLKRDMVARGYTVQEIIDVVAAKRGGKGKAPASNVPPAKPIKQPVFSP